MVSPAKAPPNKTSTAAIVRYSHRLGSSGSGESSDVIPKKVFMGAADTVETWQSPRKATLASPRIAVRVEVTPLSLDRSLAEERVEGIAAESKSPPMNAAHSNQLVGFRVGRSTTRNTSRLNQDGRWEVTQTKCSQQRHGIMKDEQR